MTDIINSIGYVIGTPYFWITMGAISSVSMFIGAMIFDGDRSAALKSILSIIIYAFFLFFVQFWRIINVAIAGNIKDPRLAYASTISLVFVTFFWVAGTLIGVGANRLVKHDCRSPFINFNSIWKHLSTQQ